MSILTDTIYKGFYVLPKGLSLNIRKLPSTRSDILSTAIAGDIAGYVFKKIKEGQEPDKDGKMWYLIYLKMPVKGNVLGFVRVDAIKLSKDPPVESITTDTARRVLAELIVLDQKVYQRLLVAFEILARARQRNINTAEQEQEFKNLALNYTKRQAKLMVLGDIEAFKNSAFDWLRDKFAETYPPAHLSGLGAFPLIPVAVGVVVGVTITAALYFAVKPLYDEATVDFKQSEQFKAWINTIPEDDRKAIIQDIESQIDEAYNTGLFEGKVGGIWSIAKPVLVAVGGFIIITKVIGLAQDGDKLRKKNEIKTETT